MAKKTKVVTKVDKVKPIKRTITKPTKIKPVRHKKPKVKRKQYKIVKAFLKKYPDTFFRMWRNQENIFILHEHQYPVKGLRIESMSLPPVLLKEYLEKWIGKFSDLGLCQYAYVLNKLYLEFLSTLTAYLSENRGRRVALPESAKNKMQAPLNRCLEKDLNVGLRYPPSAIWLEAEQTQEEFVSEMQQRLESHKLGFPTSILEKDLVSTLTRQKVHFKKEIRLTKRNTMIKNKKT